MACATSQEITIPTVDISSEYKRHVIVACGTKQDSGTRQEVHRWGQGRGSGYQGHPNTLLLPDGKTMFCVWQTYGHGGHVDSLKKSTDGGRTWSNLLELPDNWYHIGRGHPTIHRLVDGEGTARLFVFCRNYDRSSMLQAISEDNGKTWSPMRENGLMAWTAPQNVEAVEGGKKHLMWYERDTEGRGAPGIIWQSASTDGGLTWEDSKPVVELENAGLSEPGMVRSPDKKHLLLLIRENEREYNSICAVSSDEGQSWSEPKELPLALTGDRHDGVYAPDGRLVVVFRDKAEGASTHGHFVAWVGRFEDILEGREGQFRVKLLHCYAQDTGYPGIEILPDGTIVATTYIKYKPDEKNSVVSTRFKLQELDQKLGVGA